MASFLSLPNELIGRVGDYLPDKELANLSQAAQAFNEILCPLLLKRSMEDKPRPVVNMNALIWAVQQGHTGLVKTVVSQPNFSRGRNRIYNFPDPRHEGDVYNALALAAELGHTDIIPILISAGYGVEGSRSKSPLHLAVTNAHASTVSKLLDHGAEIDKKCGAMTALVCAIRAPWEIKRNMVHQGISGVDDPQTVQAIEARAIATIQVLLSRGAHPELRAIDRYGNTPLHHAVFRCIGSTRDPRVGAGILRLLVDAGSDISAMNEDKCTPLEIAVVSHCTTALTFFLDIGLSPNTKGIEGMTLLQSTLIWTPTALPIIQVLLERGATTNDVLHTLFSDAKAPNPVVFEKILILLLIHGASFGEDASQCFAYAALHGMLAVMKIVLETCPGIDINTTLEADGGGRAGNALQLAIGNDRADIVGYLVEIGAEMSVMERMVVEIMLG